MIFTEELFFYVSKSYSFIYTQLFENLNVLIILKSMIDGLLGENKPSKLKRSIALTSCLPGMKLEKVGFYTI